MLLSQKQTSTILDEVQQKFGHILGQTWSVAASKVASLPDGTAALGDRLTIWNGKDTFVVDCNENSCQLSKLTFEKKEGWGIPFIWGCAQQVPDASHFASSHIGNVDAGNIQELPTAQDGEGADATSATDVCEDGNKTCLGDTVSQTQDTVDASDTKDVGMDVVLKPNLPCIDPNNDGNLSDVIVDSNLRAAINATLGTPITTDVALKLIDLSPISLGSITTLAGLQCFPNLKTITLQNTKIVDLAPLQGLTELAELRLMGCQIGDISSLSGLIQLKNLWLQNNQITDVTPLKGLTQLTFLWLDNNQITSITPLQGLTNLQTLSLNHNQISSVSPLQGLLKLEALHLEYNQISSVSQLQGVTWLTGLNLRGNQISDITPLKGLTKLKSLGLQNMQISDITPLKGLTELVGLVLNDNQISDISPLQGLAQLINLQVSNNWLSNILPLQNLVQLKILYLGGNQVDSVAAIQGMTQLYDLNLSNNKVGDITPLIQNSGLGSSDTVTLSGNPMIPASQVQQLKDKGVTIK